MSEKAWVGNNRPLTSEELTTRLEDVVGSESKSGNVLTSNNSGALVSKNEKKANAVQAFLNAHTNLTPEQRSPYESKIADYGGTTSSRMAGINSENIQALIQQLKHFQETTEGDWTTVVSQWYALKGCWQDRQYIVFEPFFENLCGTYSKCDQQCEEYIQFLQARIRASEDAIATINL